MFRKYALMALICIAISGCSLLGKKDTVEGFERDVPTTSADAPLPETRDSRPLVSEVVAVRADRYPGGVIVRARGLPTTQGYWDAGLVRRGVQNGVLVLEFRAVPPTKDAPAGTQRSREIDVAIDQSDRSLRGIRAITVIGQQNSQTVRP